MSISIKICKACRKKQGAKLLKKINTLFPNISCIKSKCLKKCKGTVLQINIDGDIFIVRKLRTKKDRQYLLETLERANPKEHLKQHLGHLLR